MDTFEGAEPVPGRIIVTVYKLVHRDTGKFYIGSSGNFFNRRRKHIEALRRNEHHAKELQELYNESPYFIFVLDSIGVDHTDPNVREKAFDREQVLLDMHRGDPLLLNKSRNARYPDIVLSEESKSLHREKVRQAHQRPEVREKVTKVNQALRQSEKAREQQSEISKAMWTDSTHRARMESVWRDPDYLRRQVENQPTSKPVVAANQQYGSVSQAAKHLGIGRNTVKKNIKDPACSDYYWIDQSQ
jgi:hypothetical protein